MGTRNRQSASSSFGARLRLAALVALATALLGTLPIPRGSAAAPGRPGSEVIAEARRHIRHIVWITKENRSFDSMFGRFPGAEGATRGRTCHRTSTIPLIPAPDHVPDIEHTFLGGLVSIDGGKMDCFDRLFSDSSDYRCPHRCPSYLQYRPPPRLPAGPRFVGIPNYWTYAKRFELADHFFTPIEGPSGVEHLWTIGGRATGSWTT